MDATPAVPSPPPCFTRALGTVLSHLARGTAGPLGPFDAIHPPAIPIAAYLSRLETYFDCSPECFVLALIYVDRVVLRQPDIIVSPHNVHRLTAVALLLAVKFNDDTYFTNSFYARVAGMRTRELNALEAQFLELISWRLGVKPEEYAHYLQNVMFAVGDRPKAEDVPTPTFAPKAEAEACAPTDHVQIEPHLPHAEFHKVAAVQPEVGMEPEPASPVRAPVSQMDVFRKCARSRRLLVRGSPIVRSRRKPSFRTSRALRGTRT